MIYTTGTIAVNGNTVKGTGTNFSEPLSLIRVGCTLIAISNPIQIFTVTEIKSGTELSVTPAANPAIAAGTKFSILLSDSISVDGLAQDVAETLRYYQSKETEISAAVEWWNEFGGDGQMEQLLADIRAETAKSTANAQKTESDKNASAASKTAAANSATAAKASQDAAKASETAASNSKTAAATSETNAAKSAADALNYRNQAQAITGSNIGLSSNPRDCQDISGNPSGYLGFLRIMEGAAGWPSIASGERYLSGFICPTLGSVPAFSGLFIGHITGSAYTYKWSESTGPQWTRHARKDEVSRLMQIADSQTRLYSGNGKIYFEIGNNCAWGVYDSEIGQWKPLDIAQGGTAGRNAGQARTNLEVMREQKSALNETNINTLTGEYSGFYYQTTNSAATTERGYPLATAGSLLVIKNGANSASGCTQLYFPYNAINGVFYMRQYIVQEWSAWKKFQSLDFADSPQFKNLNLVISSDNETTNGGILQSILNNASGVQRARTRIYTEFRGDGKAWATTHLHRNDINVYAGLSEDGDFALNKGSFIGKTAKLLSNVDNPLTLTSANPCIRFDETDRPENTPVYDLIANGGNLFIYKSNYDDTGSTSTAISYNFSNDRLDVTNIKASGNVTCLAVNQTSDRDLKDNIQVIGDATEAIRKMNGYTYTLKENGLPYAGVIAQEVMEALPEAVGSFTHYGEELQGPTVDGRELREETRYLNVDYAAVTGLLVQVARETDNRVTELEEENASLRANIAEMDERIAKLEALVSKLTGSEK
ncbi:pyocin knob domain-containing S74 family peptidase [Escherichia coli]|uniref:pyocin knob domain-containing S74 family peptidase n=1 Tax=Escherichia coli TaxID=562 RepID=UPI0007A5EFBF|nr:pyocin knob domain-containing S74 family peptidase [Escherichia coli]